MRRKAFGALNMITLGSVYASSKPNSMESVDLERQKSRPSPDAISERSESMEEGNSM